MAVKRELLLYNIMVFGLVLAEERKKSRATVHSLGIFLGYTISFLLVLNGSISAKCRSSMVSWPSFRMTYASQTQKPCIYLKYQLHLVLSLGLSSQLTVLFKSGVLNHPSYLGQDVPSIYNLFTGEKICLQSDYWEELNSRKWEPPFIPSACRHKKGWS